MFGKNRNRSYTNGEITIYWQGDKCNHSTQCYSRLRSVFDPIRRPWINPLGAPTKEILGIIEQCPTEALTFRWNDSVANENETSPKLFRGDVEATFARPNIDKSADKSTAVSTDKSTDQSADQHADQRQKSSSAQHLPHNDRDGKAENPPTKIDLRANGPIVVSGNFDVVDSSGIKMAKVEMISLCRCGASGNTPYCDGTHFKIGFRA